MEGLSLGLGVYPRQAAARFPFHRRDALYVEWLKRQKRFPAKAENRGVVFTSYLRLIDSCTTQLQAQGPSWTCNES